MDSGSQKAGQAKDFFNLDDGGQEGGQENKPERLRNSEDNRIWDSED
jgi:hypothetical protein